MIHFLNLQELNRLYLDEIQDAVSQVISSGYYIGGPVNERFETALSSYLGVPHVVGVSNGLDALTLIFLAYIELGRLRPGDEVIVPANTYVASLLAVSRAGLVPVPVEPARDTLNLDSTLIEDAVTGRTRAIMPVHLYGRTCWDATLVDTVRRHNLLVVEDNAQGLGSISTVPGLDGVSCHTGSLGDAAALSFYPTKNLGALGDAGAVATRDALLASTVRAIANYGSDRRYHNIFRGLNCRLDPIQAAVLSVKLPFLDRDNDRRRAIAARYRDRLSNSDISLAMPDDLSTTNFHQLVALSPDRDALRRHLDLRGIGTDIHYAVPPHRQPCYAAELSRYSLPVTDYLADHVVSLPIAPYLTDAEVDTVIDSLNNFILPR